MPGEGSLTLKQELFVKWYTHPDCTGNGTESCRRAGYKGNDKTLERMGRQNLANPRVAQAIAERKTKIFCEADVTIGKVLKDLETTRTKALEAGQHSAAAKCSELHGKYLKMFTDRIEHVQTLDDMTESDLANILRDLLKSSKIDDLNRFLAGHESDNSGLHSGAGTTTAH